ncbi:MAG TPA: tetratricopeptide repeat protein [Tepidisphaeraceae bacterium]|jgi:predicted O-linked N-acetylglucosamine transferase (SPINDLY family)|nr:tetratricopeptide repeat protein [Tepidisphaeraceae bacterium]
MTAPASTQMVAIAFAHHQAGRLAEAEACYREILRRDPANPDALHLLGTLAFQQKRNDDARELIERAIAIEPRAAEFHASLGQTLAGAGRLHEAVAAYRRSVALGGGAAEIHYNLGCALLQSGFSDDAADPFKTAIALRSDFHQAHLNLSNVLRKQGDLDGAIECCRAALAINPALPVAHVNLGQLQMKTGELAEAIASFDRAMKLDPALAEARSGKIYALHFQPGVDAQTLLRESLLWNEHHAKSKSIGALVLLAAPSSMAKHAPQAGPLNAETLQQPQKRSISTESGVRDDGPPLIAEDGSPRILPHGPQASALGYRERPGAVLTRDDDRSPDRRLRIGYVSPDFRRHVAGFYLLPLLREHDHDRFEIFCYSNVRLTDAITDRFRSCADAWRDISRLDDAAAASLIREDRIDILFDATMHMGGNRLGLFYLKPAPVQATMCAYPGTTGLDAMDYRLTDPYLDPPGTDALYAERSIRLPNSFWCYDPIEATPDVGPLPAGDGGAVTFGCLNNFCKINGDVLALWASVMRAVPDSRLLLLAPRGQARSRALAALANMAIDSARVSFVEHQPRPQYFATYNRIDIGLDTFPYNGHTTGLDAFWMGVPVITLVGHTAVGRAGLSQLTNLGLPELAAFDAEQFVEIATRLANDRHRLAALRDGLRDRLSRSPLADVRRFARDVENAMRRMWEQIANARAGQIILRPERL